MHNLLYPSLEAFLDSEVELHDSDLEASIALGTNYMSPEIKSSNLCGLF